jgi:large subunit ribosomal protein L2
MFGIIKRPIFTEKTTRLLEKNQQYVFDVDRSLTKPQVRFLIEKRFLVHILRINTHCIPPKKRRGGVSKGLLPIFKRVIVTLRNKEKIVFLLILSFLFISIFIMVLRYFRPISPGTRHTILDSFAEITHNRPEKKLLQSNQRAQGRNHRGVITCRHRGGGHKRLYRKVDIWRKKLDIIGFVRTIEYDPNRNSRLALVQYEDGEKRYVLVSKGLQVGQTIITGFRIPIEIGNTLPLWNIPLGINVYNVEFRPGEGRKLARSAGTNVQLVARESGFVTLRLPSGEVRLVPQTCWATIGQVCGLETRNKKIGKAGRIRWLGFRPTVRGKVINPVDHPHGGGEGCCPIGRPQPSTPWGKPRLGVKTRRTKKYSTTLIVRRNKLYFISYISYGSIGKKRSLCSPSSSRKSRTYK